MPEGYQRQTPEGKNARTWGAGAALGGLAIAFVAYLGLISESNSEYSACDVPKPTETCQSVKDDQATLSRVLKVGGAAALVGAISFLGADALDRRLVIKRFVPRTELLEVSGDDPDMVDRIVSSMPAAPQNPDDSKKWT